MPSLLVAVEQTLRILMVFIWGKNPNLSNISIMERPFSNLNDSDYESDPSLKIIDCDSYSASNITDENIQYDYDDEIIFQPLAQECTLSQRTILSTSNILGNTTRSAEFNQVMTDNLWS